MKNYPISLTGKITNPHMALDAVLAYYFKALKHSSTIAYKEVRSLTYDLNTANNSGEVQSNIEASVIYLLKDTFKDFKVEVVVELGDNQTYDIVIDAVCRVNGEVVSVSKLINATNSKVNIVKDILTKGSR